MPAVKSLRALVAGAAVLLGAAGARGQVRPLWQWEDAVNPGAIESARMVREAQMNALHELESRAYAAHLTTRARAPGVPPEEAAIMLARARTYSRQAADERAAATTLYDQALALTPRSTDALRGRAGLYAREGEYPRQLALLERARDTGDFSNDPLELAHLQFDIGVVHTRLLRFADARDAYLAALGASQVDDDNSATICNLAETYGYLHEMQRSIETFQRCISAAPGEATGWWGVAVAYDRNGQDLESSEAARRARGMDPDLDNILSENVFYVPEYERHYYLAIAREAQDNSAEALREWENYIDAGGPNAPWVERAHAHRDRLAAELSARARRARSQLRAASPTETAAEPLPLLTPPRAPAAAPPAAAPRSTR